MLLFLIKVREAQLHQEYKLERYLYKELFLLDTHSTKEIEDSGFCCYCMKFITDISQRIEKDVRRARSNNESVLVGGMKGMKRKVLQHDAF